MTVCPTGQIRYGDNCYEKAMAADSDILSNLDACGAKLSSLWSPETSNEIAFITKNFPSAGNLYHLGIEQYVTGKGMISSDNSFSVGVPFYTGEKLLNHLISLDLNWACTSCHFKETSQFFKYH